MPRKKVKAHKKTSAYKVFGLIDKRRRKKKYQTPTQKCAQKPVW